MIVIKEITNKDLKTKITLDIMLALPKWFSPRVDIENKSIIHRDYPFFVAYDDDKVIGFVTLKIHNKYTADIYNLGVLEEYHRKGVGHKLVNRCLEYCLDNDFTYLTVKTLDSSADYEPYDRTRAFYKKCGFIPLEVFKTLWTEENPCLFLVKRIK